MKFHRKNSYMLIFKFTKTKSAALAAHVDSLRAVTYLMRRAGVRADYSQGFNPHMELGFTSPIPLGVESVAEYVSVKTSQTENLLSALNAACPDGMSFVRQWNASLNLAATFNRARYRLESAGLGDVIGEITASGYCIAYDDRGKPVVKDVSSKIFAAERVNSDCALVTLTTGNDNLRPDRLVLHLLKAHGLTGDYRIVKLASFADEICADDFLDGIAGEKFSL